MSRYVSSPYSLTRTKISTLSKRLLVYSVYSPLCPSLPPSISVERRHGGAGRARPPPPFPPPPRAGRPPRHGAPQVAWASRGGTTRLATTGGQSRSPPRELLQIVGAGLLFLETSAAPTAPVFLASSSPRFGPSSPSLRTSPYRIFLSPRSWRLAPLRCGRRSTCGRPVSL